MFCNLGAKISDLVFASDASEKGGAAGIARSLSEAGKDFAEASSLHDKMEDEGQAPILLLSLFNGVGGAVRSYDIAGVLQAARIAVEIDDAANRVCSRRWLDTDWGRKCLAVHIWAGFPCADLSKVKCQRENF